LEIYDILGRKAFTLVNQFKKAGNYTVFWDAYNFSSGTYFSVFATNGTVLSKKLILIK